MRIIFMGTPDFAVPILECLTDEEKASGHEVVAVVTQPDRRKGRGHGMMFSPVKEYAITLGLPVLQPEKVKSEDFEKELEKLGADIFVVVAYGQILQPKLLQMPPKGCINIHASLLPKYRGAAPMQRAIINGDKVTGVTIMHMDKGLDTGDMILKKTMEIKDSDRFAEVYDKMVGLSCEGILEALEQIERGVAVREPQNDAESTYAAMLTKQDGVIDWSKPTESIVNQVRALDPWPGTFTYYEDQMLKIWDCVNFAVEDKDKKPGEVLESQGQLLVKTGDGALSCTVLQGQGGKRMNVAEYLRGREIKVGTILGG